MRLCRQDTPVMMKIDSNYKVIDQQQEYSLSQIQRLSRKYQQFIPSQSKVIGISIDNSVDWVALDLMCIQTHRTLVPIPSFFNKEQVAYLINESGIETLITNSKKQLKAHGFLDNIESINRNYIGSLPVEKDRKHHELLSDTQKVTFTSGSTGFPKGICLSTQSQFRVANDLVKVLLNLKIKKHMSLLPFSILLENVAGTYTTMLLGGENHIYPLKDVGFDGVMFQEHKCIALIIKHQIESIILLPQLLEQIINYMEKEDLVLPSLKFVAVGGAKVSESLLLRAEKLGLPVFEGYGLSECSSVVAVNHKDHHLIGSVGEVLSSRQVRVIDHEIEVFLEEGLRYLNGNTIDPGWYKTGDLGEIKDNLLFITGRKKNVVITSVGRNISPEWPESILLEDKRIAQAMITCFDQPYLSAILITNTELSQIEKKNLLKQANKKLPAYAQIKECINLDAPFTYQQGTLTANGRLKRNVILQNLLTNKQELERELYEIL
jgi:long-chain acyl-CoA synthetase